MNQFGRSAKETCEWRARIFKLKSPAANLFDIIDVKPDIKSPSRPDMIRRHTTSYKIYQDPTKLMNYKTRSKLGTQSTARYQLESTALPVRQLRYDVQLAI